MILDIVVAIIPILIVRKADTNIVFNKLPIRVLECSCVCITCLHGTNASMSCDTGATFVTTINTLINTLKILLDLIKEPHALTEIMPLVRAFQGKICRLSPT